MTLHNLMNLVYFVGHGVHLVHSRCLEVNYICSSNVSLNGGQGSVIVFL